MFSSSDYERQSTTDFNKIKVGTKTLEDAVLNLGSLKRINQHLANKDTVLTAIAEGDLDKMREISDFFYKTSGIYSRLCRYMAYLYRYDWVVTPYVNQTSNIKEEKIIEGFYKALTYLDNFEVKKFLGEVALKVIRQGCYYGYLIPQANRMAVQELPPKYCRSRYSINNRPVVEFNMRFFDDNFMETQQRIKVLKLFPKEFQKGYILYKENKLQPEFLGDTNGWYTLEPGRAIKFNINGEDFPAFISVIPSIIDLNAAQDLDRQKMAQKLLKIIIQKMPLDKNGDPIFDIDEARELHNNAIQMLSKAIGVDVLTTFADVDVADMADNGNVSSVDELSKVERAVYNEAGVSQMQFNTDGNLALEKSILNDEASIYNLIIQFEDFLNSIIRHFYKNPNKLYFKAQILTTTIYNYKEMSKMYKEQMQLGFSKLLPQIALGQSQSMILATAYFENEVLDLVTLFIPPMMSSTMNTEAIDKIREENKAGRPSNEELGKEVSDKTLANKEAES